MILADSSAWIEYDRATGSDVDLRLTEIIAAGPRSTSSPLLAVTDPVVAEVAMAAGDFDGATHIYRTCRRAGVTPRGLVDCMIAAVAIRHDAALLGQDADLNRIAQVMDLRLDVP